MTGPIQTTAALAPAAPASPGLGTALRFLAGHKTLVAGVAILSLLSLVAVCPQLFTGIDPLRTSPLAALKPIGTPDHWLGTDYLGRDIWSRIVHGSRTGMMMGVGAMAIAVFFGSILGAWAGLSGRRMDAALNGSFDVMFAFPELLLALLMITMLGAGSFNAMLAIGIGGIPSFARMMRGEIRRIRFSGFIESSTALGVPRATNIRRHMLPNAIGPTVVLASLFVGRAIIYGASLSFLGLGPARPTPEWGLMLADAQLYLGMAPWVAIFPGAAIMLAATGSVLLARGLRSLGAQK